MPFAYMGFTQEANIRHFHFQRVLPRVRGANAGSVVRFTLDADMSLFARFRVPVQEGPAICLQILRAASAGDEQNAAEPASYAVTYEHLSNFASARAQSAEAKLARRRSRPPFKPSGASQLKWPRTH